MHLTKQVLIKKLKIYLDRPFTGSGSDLRRAITGQFKDVPVLHNHIGDRFDYRSPRVRYVVIDGIPQLISFDRGLDIIERIYVECRQLRVNHGSYMIFGVELEEEPVKFGASNSAQFYRSASPWIALNEKNHIAFMNLSNDSDRQHLLEKILVGNYLALCKTLGIFVEDKIIASIDAWQPCNVYEKEVAMLGFMVQFTTNFFLPQGIGLGKWTAIGYGLMQTSLQQIR